MACRHEKTAFYREPVGLSSFAVAERCTACGVNVRGPGFRVASDELAWRRLDPTTLPVWRDPNETPRSLFGGNT